MTDEEINDIEALANAATPGPWKLWGMHVMADPHGTSNVDDALLVAKTSDPVRGLRTWNAEFIACARLIVPALVTEVRRLRDLLGKAAAAQANLEAEAVAVGEQCASAERELNEAHKEIDEWKELERRARFDAAKARHELAQLRASVDDRPDVWASRNPAKQK